MSRPAQPGTRANSDPAMRPTASTTGVVFSVRDGATLQLWNNAPSEKRRRRAEERGAGLVGLTVLISDKLEVSPGGDIMVEVVSQPPNTAKVITHPRTGAKVIAADPGCKELIVILPADQRLSLGPATPGSDVTFTDGSKANPRPDGYTTAFMGEMPPNRLRHPVSDTSTRGVDPVRVINDVQIPVHLR